MFARTQRLLLRPGWMEDAPALAHAIGDEAVVRNLSRAPFPYAVSDAEEFLASDSEPMLPRFLIFSRTHGAPRLIGGVGLHRDEEDAPELGYWIARQYWGLGFATEAARAVMGIARATGIVGVRSCHMIDNPASGKVLRKAGFRATGRVAQRYSTSRRTHVPCAIFEEDDGTTDMRDPDGGAAFMLGYDDVEMLAA